MRTAGAPRKRERDHCRIAGKGRSERSSAHDSSGSATSNMTPRRAPHRHLHNAGMAESLQVKIFKNDNPGSIKGQLDRSAHRKCETHARQGGSDHQNVRLRGGRGAALGPEARRLPAMAVAPGALLGLPPRPAGGRLLLPVLPGRFPCVRVRPDPHRTRAHPRDPSHPITS